MGRSGGRVWFSGANMDAQTALLARVSQYCSGAEQDLVHCAIEAAGIAHQGKVRKNGTPLIAHCIAVGDILASWNAPADIVAAGLLHNMLVEEYSEHRSVEALTSTFGAAVMQTVQDVTGLRRFGLAFRPRRGEIPLDAATLTLNLPWVAIAVQQAPYAMVIRIADRLENLRAVHTLPAAERAAFIAGVSKLFVPCADLLGMRAARRELEDGVFQMLEPAKYAELRALYNPTTGKGEDDHLLDEFRFALKGNSFAPLVQRASVSLYALYRAELEQGRSLPSAVAHPILVLVESPEACYEALGLVHKVRKPVPGQFWDYVASPKPDGYRALHTCVYYPGGTPLTVLIRSRDMHLVAEHGVTAKWLGVPEDHLPDPGRWSPPAKGKVIVFTRDGDPVALPEGATPLDFAYALHRQLGNQCGRVFVNGVEARLNDALQNGDVIKIVKNDEALGPQPEWLDFAKTEYAKKVIRRALRSRNTPAAQQRGREALDATLQEHGLTLTSHHTMTKLREAAERLKYDEYAQRIRKKTDAQPADPSEHLLSDIGHGHIAPDRVVLHMPVATRDEVSPKGTAGGSRQADNSAEPYLLAGCCRPQPPRPIVRRYAPKKRCMVVHCATCGNVRGKTGVAPCDWDTIGWRPALEIEVKGGNRVGLFRDVSAAIAKGFIDILVFDGRRLRDGSAKMRIQMHAIAPERLDTLLERIRTVPKVNSARVVTPLLPSLARIIVYDHSNPYTYKPASGPVFFGREDEIELLINKLPRTGSGETVLLWGPRRIGKTSLLREIRRRLLANSDYLPVFVDCQGMSGQPITDLLHKIAETIERDLTNPLVHAPNLARMQHNPLGYFTAFMDSVHEYESRHLILMLDEFQFLATLRAGDNANLSDVAACFRSLSLHGEGLSLIMCGGGILSNLLQLGGIASLFGIAHSEELDCLARVDAERLIVDPVKLWVDYGPEVIKRLLDETDSHPFYLQLVLKKLFARVHPPEKSSITVADLDDVLTNWLPRLEEMYFSHTWGENCGLDSHCVDRNGMVLATIACCSDSNQWVAYKQVAQTLSDTGIARADLAEALQQLTDLRTVLNQYDDQWRIKIPVVHRWVRGRYPLLSRRFSR